MASLTTYLLVSGVDEPSDVEAHSVTETHDLEVRATQPGDSDEEVPSVTLVHECALEDRVDLASAARTLSGDFPAATVVYCVVEERFDHVERLQTLVFRDGLSAGRIEHGYVFNIGDG